MDPTVNWSTVRTRRVIKKRLQFEHKRNVYRTLIITCINVHTTSFSHEAKFSDCLHHGTSKMHLGLR